jgi:CRP-like cAMP-binding protein
MLSRATPALPPAPGSPLAPTTDPAPCARFPGAGRPLLRTLDRGVLLYSQDDPATALYQLECGAIRLYRLSPQGQLIALACVLPGETFGEEVLLGLPTRALYAETLERSRVRVIGRATLSTWLKQEPALRLVLLQTLWARLGQVERQVENLITRRVPQRLAHELLALAEQAGQRTARGVRLPAWLTHYTLAERIGCRRETVTLVLGDLARAGLIARDPARPRTIVLPDLARLARYAEEAEAPQAASA